MSRKRPAGPSRRASAPRGERRAPPAARTSFSPARLAAWAAPALLALVLFLPSLPYAFVWDDHGLIENNLLLRTPGGLLTLLRSDFGYGVNPSGLWRPWITFSYWLDGTLSGFSPAWLRAMNVAGHAGVTALVAAFALAAGAGAWVALGAAAWFAAMPAHVESVAWIAGRTDVYCALAGLAALWLDRRAREKGMAFAAAALACFALSLLAKEVGLAFLAVIAADRWCDPSKARPGALVVLRAMVPYAAISIAYAAAHAALVHAPVAGGHLGQAARAHALESALALLPANLVFLWPAFAHSPAATLALPGGMGDPVVLAGGALWLALALALGWAAWRRDAALAPLALLAGGILPLAAINLTHGYLVYGERYFYLSSAGVAWLAASLASRPRVKQFAPAAAAALLALTLCSAWVSSAILPRWRDDAALFQGMTVAQPRNYMGHIQWARILADRGQSEEATRELEFAERLDAERPDAASIRAVLASRRGDWAGALAQADRAVRLGSRELEPALLRITALLGLSRLEEAGAALASIRASRPPHPSVEALEGQYLLAARRPAEARDAMREAARRFPRDPDLPFTLGLAETALGSPAEAARAFERAVALKPLYYEAWIQLAIARSEGGDASGAVDAARSAARLPAAADGRAAQLLSLLGAR